VISPKLVEVGRHNNIALLTLSEVNDISGEEGDFTVHITQYPRYVDMDKCIACGVCAEKCPSKVIDEYDAGLVKRKAAYVKYAQAVPLKYAIDDKHCLKLTKDKCGLCQKRCPTGAINYEDTQKELELKVGAVIVASGCEVYDPGRHDVYGYLRSPDIVTSLEFERILSASGPYGGHLQRPSDNVEPKKIAWLQCIGSRDEHIGARGYCSSVCCTYAIKEAMLAKAHSNNGLDTAIFYMDVRTHGKDFERYYNRGRDEAGIRFIKSKVTTIVQDEESGMQRIRYIDEGGRRVYEDFDMVVLSVGLGVSPDAVNLAEKLAIKKDRYNYIETSSFAPVSTSRPGIYVCGAVEAPKDIPTSVIDSSAAAGAAGSRLAPARWSLTKTKPTPAEVDVRGEPPRIGVFICRCGTNIASVVDVEAVVEYAKSLPYVVFAEANMFSCSQDTQDMMTRIIKEKKLNRLVVSACTPKTHEPLFQETVVNAGINKYLFEMANIRNQCAWVHPKDPQAATAKAKDLTRMAVAKVALHQPLAEPQLEVNPVGLVIGGGFAGMTAAKSLADQGYRTFLVEKESVLGGQARRLHETWQGEDVQQQLRLLTESVLADERIEVHLDTAIKAVDGFVGNFKTTIESAGKESVLEHGVAIIATGANEFKPDEFGYGRSDKVMTSLELDQRLIKNDPKLAQAKTTVFIQCVGSRIPERPYCSKVCCTHSIKNSLALKKLNPDMDIFILYRDLRAYGLREDLYREARKSGIQFLRYDQDMGLDVDLNGDTLKVTFNYTVLQRRLTVTPDHLVLATAIVPPAANNIARMLKATVNADTFFMEAHVKLRPVDCATDGVFICGLAHGPKPIDETIAQAAAAATRAVTLLAKKKILMSGTVAFTHPPSCSGCGICVNICPYSAPGFTTQGPFAGKAEINPVLCKGCGLCAASCRSGAIHLRGFDNDQIFSQLFALREAG
jgi:heterodisulfide reductase subunit A